MPIFKKYILVNHSRVTLKGKTVLDSTDEDGAMELKIPIEKKVQQPSPDSGGNEASPENMMLPLVQSSFEPFQQASKSVQTELDKYMNANYINVRETELREIIW
jgi:hypothetical protein